MPSIRKILLLLLLSLGFRPVAQGQAIRNASYRTIGHASGIPMEWAAFYFFFHE